MASVHVPEISVHGSLKPPPVGLTATASCQSPAACLGLVVIICTVKYTVYYDLWYVLCKQITMNNITLILPLSLDHLCCGLSTAIPPHHYFLPENTWSVSSGHRTLFNCLETKGLYKQKLHHTMLIIILYLLRKKNRYHMQLIII